jgi:hypothetical protein
MDGIKTAFGGISTPIMDDGSGRELHKVWGLGSSSDGWMEVLPTKGLPKSVINSVQKPTKNNEY